MKRLGLGILTAFLAFLVTATPVYAIALPDATPSIDSKYVYRNVLETGDMLFLIYENTPYATVPAVGYRTAYVWRLIDTDGTTELAQALGYEYNDSGYGFNVISFYLTAAQVTAKGIAWGDALFLRLSGTPAAFTTPPVYQYSVVAGDYSGYTTTTDVQLDIATKIRTIAADLNNKWGLSTTTVLLDDSETTIILSLYGQSFFRGAVYGIQAMAPSLFPLVISDVDTTLRTWTTNYTSALAEQMTGNPIGTAIEAGKNFLDVDYNLLGLILAIGVCVVLVVGNWMIARQGDLWKGGIESAAQLVIFARIGLMGFGELCLVAALCWIYVSAKLWRMI